MWIPLFLDEHATSMFRVKCAGLEISWVTLLAVKKVVLQIHGRERGEVAPSGSIRMINRRTALSIVTGENWGNNGLFEDRSVVLHYERKGIVRKGSLFRVFVDEK
jgi:hypothetical protein